jgi:hypothetical protein
MLFEKALAENLTVCLSPLIYQEKVVGLVKHVLNEMPWMKLFYTILSLCF